MNERIAELIEEFCTEKTDTPNIVKYDEGKVRTLSLLVEAIITEAVDKAQYGGLQ